jgi:signal transduction histidine kinase
VISHDHIKNFKNIKAVEYARKINDVIIDALTEINKYELEQQIKDSLKHQYWATIRTEKERHLRFYLVNENGKRNILQQIVAANYPNISKIVTVEEMFHDAAYLPMFVSGEDIIAKIIKDIHLYSLFDTIGSHLSAVPVYSDNEINTIYSIIKKHLCNNNIDTNIQCCIYIPAFNQCLLCKHKGELLNVLNKGYLYNFEMYNENVALCAFFMISFSKEANYLSFYDYFTIVFTWAVVLLIYLLFVYLLFTEKKISEVLEQRNEFVNNITHEFKTPIATIRLATEGLSDNDILANKEIRNNYVHIIQTENTRLEYMVGTLLERTLISKKTFWIQQKRDNLDIHYCIDGAIKEVLLLLQEKNGIIEMDYSATQSIVYMDGYQITMVIKNILENAIKYKKDTIPPHIEIATINKGKYVIVSIKDNGIGIGKRQLKKIFYKLYRIPTRNTQPIKGYGLGLYNAQAIIKSHRGKITVESELNKGSIFKIWIQIIKK